MRGSLLLVAAGVIAVGVACAAVTRFDDAGAQEPPRAETARVDSAQLHRDLEVMRRLLAREGLGKGETGIRLAAGEVLSSAAGQVTFGTPDYAVEAFHVAGDGALFLVRTSDAVAAPPGAVTDEAEPKPARTAWDEIADEVEGRPSAAKRAMKRQREPNYDAQKVDALRARILEQLAKNGERIRGLGADEGLTVVVVGGSQSAYGSVYGSVLRLGVAAQADGTVRYLDSPSVQAASGRSVLTIRVKQADCRRCAKGEIDLDEFRRRAVIAAY